ncbi:hypothetical protein OPV22_012143 [Ensete ventricosum]|uniref:Uncharacterized protein n=1 Tax=Ensete ventricosum TaxID=4639 RepID=A0AAV8R6F1_ENSVE|nr:hypothetical protein OPV22_012143 [Ensete ventricosum]
MAASFATPFLTGGIAQSKKCGLQNEKLKSLSVYPSHLAVPKISKLRDNRPNLFVRAEYSDGSRGGGGDFVAGFLLGGAIFGTLSYVFAPQIRRSLLNEDESGFQKAKRPIYYDDGLEKTRQTLNSKISQLNNVIDNISSRLRGRNNVVTEFVDADSEVESAM